MNPKEIIKKLKEGRSKLQPIDFLRAKVTGHYWAVVGLILGGGMLVYQGVWFFSIVILATMWLQFFEWKQSKQQYAGMLEMQKKLEEMAVNKTTEVINNGMGNN